MYLYIDNTYTISDQYKMRYHKYCKYYITLGRHGACRYTHHKGELSYNDYVKNEHTGKLHCKRFNIEGEY